MNAVLVEFYSDFICHNLVIVIDDRKRMDVIQPGHISPAVSVSQGQTPVSEVMNGQRFIKIYLFRLEPFLNGIHFCLIKVYLAEAKVKDWNLNYN